MKMKEIIGIFIIILVAISSLSLSVSSTKLVNKNHMLDDSNKYNSDEIDYYGLIIGIEKFIDPDFNNLTREEDKIDDDAIAMYDMLLNSTNFKEENIKLMLNEEATKDEIKKAIEEWLGNRADENDVVLIYYASHGGKIKLKEW